MTVESVFRHCYDSHFPTKMYNLTAVFAMRNPIGQKKVAKNLEQFSFISGLYVGYS
jgi:hypothetical protein